MEFSDGGTVIDSSPLVELWAGLSRVRISRRRVIATCLLLVIIANVGVIVWMWLHGGGVRQAHGSAHLFTSLGRIIGLLAVYLALIQILLLARLPPVERLVDFDRLTVWHRRNGKVCISLVVVHTVLITVSSYPAMVTATIGTVLMVGVVIRVLAIVRRRLPYGGCYLVHLSIYAGSRSPTCTSYPSATASLSTRPRPATGSPCTR